MRSDNRRDFDSWFAQNYSNLLEIAGRYTPDTSDLLHHVYLRAIKADPPDIMRNPAGYLHRAMWMEVTRGQFKRLMQIDGAQVMDVPDSPDPTNILVREVFEMMSDRLHWFDRAVLKLYLDGYNLTEVAKEADIKPSVLWVSVHRSKNKMRNAIQGAPKDKKGQNGPV